MTTLFLICGLILPRLTLLAAFMLGNIPPNSVPFVLDVVGAIFIPRFLLAFYAYESGQHIGWVAAYIIFGIFELIKAAKSKASDD